MPLGHLTLSRKRHESLRSHAIRLCSGVMGSGVLYSGVLYFGVPAPPHPPFARYIGIKTLAHISCQSLERQRVRGKVLSA